MAKTIVIDCQFCGKRNRFYPDLSQLGAQNPNQFKEFNSTSRYDHVADAPRPRPRPSPFWAAFWGSDAATNITTGCFAGGGSWFLTWWSGVDPAWAVVAGLVAGLGLPVLKVLVLAPPRPQSEKPKETTIKTELRIQRPDGQWGYLFDELRDKGISITDLKKAAKAIGPDPTMPGGLVISVKSIQKQGMSNHHARKVLAELQERKWAKTLKGNKTVVTQYRGKPFLEKLLK